MTDTLALLVVVALVVGGAWLLRWLGRVLTPLWSTCRCGSQTCTGCGRRR